MRVTFRSIQGSLDAINMAAEQFARAQQQVATGKRVTKPSDDPTAIGRAIQDQSEIGGIDSYVQSSDTADARLAALDSVLGSMVEKLTDALETAAKARGTTADQVSRDAGSAKMAGIRDAFLADVNTMFRGTYVFSGSRALTQPYTQVAGAWTYQGDNTKVAADIGRNRTVALAYDGQAIVQGSDATDIFTVFDSMVTAVKTGDEPTLAAGMDALNRAFNRTVQAQSLVGTDERSLADGRDQLTDLRLAGLQRLSKDRDANLADAISNMTGAQTAYQTAIAAVGRSNRTSLLDYI